MEELKKYIAPSAQISIFGRDIVTSSPTGGTGNDGVNLDEDLDIGI